MLPFAWIISRLTNASGSLSSKLGCRFTVDIKDAGEVQTALCILPVFLQRKVEASAANVANKPRNMNAVVVSKRTKRCNPVSSRFLSHFVRRIAEFYFRNSQDGTSQGRNRGNLQFRLLDRISQRLHPSPPQPWKKCR